MQFCFRRLCSNQGNLSNLVRLLIKSTAKSGSTMAASGNGTSGTVFKNSPPVIATHNGIFHADDVLACFLLKSLPEFKDATILRTRDDKLIKGADIVVDVGGKFDAVEKVFDHHQKGFDVTMDTLRPGRKYGGIKLSSAGLVYHHYGERILSNLLNLQGEDTNLVDVVWDKIYENFVKEIDAIDNGVTMCETPKYEIHTDFSGRVAHLRPAWNEESNDEILLERFHKAMDMAGAEFKDRVNYYGRIWFPVRKFVKQAIEKRFELDPSGEIIDLTMAETNASYPWKEHFFELEKELNIVDTVKFVLFTDSYGKWRVQGVPISPNSFVLRIPLNEKWRGLRDTELSTKSGINGCVFVHMSGFIGGNETREGGLDMARKSIQLHVASS